jgi:hypothetical protein
MIVGIGNLSQFGIVRDKPGHELPMNAWSEGRNIRFDNGFAAKMLGHQQVFGDPSIAPYALLGVPGQGTFTWVYPGLEKVYAYDGTNHGNITRQTAGSDVDYTGGMNGLWTGGILGGVTVLNNGVDLPQQWLPSSLGTRLEALQNWPTTDTCEVMRPFKSYLVALNLIKNGVRYPSTLRWSHPADPGAVPSSWDITDATKDAGEYTFSQSGDWLVDSLPLRDVNIVYKEGTTYGMQFIGGIDIFRFYSIFETAGAAGPNCAIQFREGKHLVLTQGDVIVHDGVQAESILDDRMRRWLGRNINSEALRRNFVTAMRTRNEVWICICTGSNTLPDQAIVWNWRTGALGHRDLPPAAAMGIGLVTNSSNTDTWDSDALPWSADTATWGQRLYGNYDVGLLIADPVNSKIYKAEETTQFDGSSMEVVLERTGLGIPFREGQPPDISSMKFIRNVWPRIEGTAGGVVSVEVGTQMEPEGAVNWLPAQDFIIGTTKKIDVLATGRLLCYRFSSNTALEWKLHGLSLDVEFRGRF